MIGLDGVETMNAAEALAGLELRVPVDRLAPLPDGTFYRHDLIGCRVETAERRSAVGTGRATSKGRWPAAGWWSTAPRGEVLVPLVAEICTDDRRRAAKRIVIEPPEGLLELNERAGRDG